MKPTRRLIRVCAALAALAGVLLLTPAPGLATPDPVRVQVADSSDNYYREPEAGAMILDGLIVRPISFVATVIGGVLYVVTLPFSALAGNAGEAGEKMVVAPAEYTFTRCLGCFHEWR